MKVYGSPIIQGSLEIYVTPSTLRARSHSYDAAKNALKLIFPCFVQTAPHLKNALDSGVRP